MFVFVCFMVVVFIVGVVFSLVRGLIFKTCVDRKSVMYDV